MFLKSISSPIAYSFIHENAIDAIIPIIQNAIILSYDLISYITDMIPDIKLMINDDIKLNVFVLNIFSINKVML